MLSVIPYAVLIVAFAESDLTNRGGLLRSRLALELGNASYALYLIHGPVTALVVHTLGKRESVAEIGVQWVIAFLAAQATAFALYKFFERPVELRLRRWQER